MVIYTGLCFFVFLMGILIFFGWRSRGFWRFFFVIFFYYFYAFQNGKQMVQEGALTALASVADSSQVI